MKNNAFIAKSTAIQGIETRQTQIAQVLSHLQKNGFGNPIAYGEGLSDFLINRKTSDSAIKIECDFPEALRPGALARLLKTESHNKRQSVYNARGIFNQNGTPIALLGLTFGNGFLDNDDNTILLQTRGFYDQKIQMTAHSVPPTQGLDRRPSVEDLLKNEYGTMNKIAMCFDAQNGMIQTLHHENWQRDAQGRKFSIPQDADFTEINRSLAHYFREKSYGSDVKLHIRAPANDTTPEAKKQSYLFSIYNAAMQAHIIRRVDTPECASIPPRTDRIYDEAADYMDAVCEHDPW